MRMWTRELLRGAALLGMAVLGGCGASGDDDDASGDATPSGAVTPDGDVTPATDVTPAGDTTPATDVTPSGTSGCDESHPDWTVGLQLCSPEASEGYTLFAPMRSTTTYLIDMTGRQVHTWDSAYTPGLSVYLLEDGSLLRTLNTGDTSVFDAGGGGGGVEVRDWDGAVTWRFDYSDSTHRQHHDVERLPNGNVLLVAWELKTGEEAVAAGRDPALLEDGVLWPDHLVEVQPTGAETGEIVWEWHVWDHLVQDYDPEAPGYGVIAEHPGRIDLNYARSGEADWTHLNSVDYNPDLDQVVLSAHNFSEIWVIDHSTTTAEAASSSGGTYGRGGDLLYRWGNPDAYETGDAGDRWYYSQHDAQWIEAGLPGEGNILVFNNGPRAGEEYSTVDEMVPAVQEDGSYLETEGEPYGPEAPVWTYMADPPTDLYSSNISGAQRLPNGDTLICEGTSGRFLEVTSDGTLVWEYVNPVTGGGALAQGEEPSSGGNPQSSNQVFRAYRYASDYAGLAGRDLTPGDYIEASAD